MRISRVIVYGEPSEPAISAESLARRLAVTLGPHVECGWRDGGLFASPTREQAHALASCIVRNMRRPFEPSEPSAEEVGQEMRSAGPYAGGGQGGIACYDGFELARVAASMIPARDAADPLAFHVVLTARLPCTYDTDGMRHHGRALVASSPSIVSTTGMVEAPARPRRYYIERAAAEAAGLGRPRAADGGRAGEFLERGDARMAEVAYGYALQAAAYRVTGRAFCGDRNCRMYNAHWQSDLLRSQLRPGRLCGRHRAAFEAHAAGEDPALGGPAAEGDPRQQPPMT